MSLKRIPLLVAVSLLIVFAAEGQKRRAVRSAPPSAVGNDCHTFGLVQAGRIADYRAVAPSGTATFTITWISDTPTRTHTTQRTVTPQATTEVETVLDGEIVGNLRGLKHFNLKGSVIVPVLGRTPLEVDVTFVPSLLAGPAAGWCVGAKWTTAPVTETIVATTAAGSFTNVVTTIESQGEVLAVGASVTVEGGTYDTVKYRGAVISGQDVQLAITWVSMEYNVVVKQDTIDAAGNVTSTLELTRLR